MYFRKRDRDRVLGSIHKLLFGHEDSWGIRLHKKDLMQAGQFPESEVFVELWDISINYPAWLHPFIDIVTEKEMSDEDKHEGEVPAIVAATRERQRSELMKVPALIEEIEDRLEEGEYVVVFLQYVDTIKAVLSRIKCEAALITGGWSGKKSQVEMEKFQSGKVQLCICQTDAGSESIDLHDIDGSRPRHVIIFPTYKSNTLIQVIGRTVRSGGKSPVVQRLVYSSGGIEEKIAKAVEGKLENLSMLMDGDLTGGNLL
jgi:superfamily II DNA or RNA helicase